MNAILYILSNHDDIARVLGPPLCPKGATSENDKRWWVEDTAAKALMNTIPEGFVHMLACASENCWEVRFMWSERSWPYKDWYYFQHPEPDGEYHYHSTEETTAALKIIEEQYVEGILKWRKQYHNE